VASDRIRELDSLRGLAAIAVVLFHLTYWYDLNRVAPFSVPFGHFGVELFFVISGFVIFMTLDRCRSTGEFAVSRFARLFPAYWCAVLLTSVVAWLAAPQWDPGLPSPATLAVNFTMLQRFFMVPEVDNSYWTLAIELSFYVAMALLFLFGRLRQVEKFCLAWIGAAALARLVLEIVGERRNLGPISSITGVFYGQFFILGMMIYRHSRGEATRLTWAVTAAACALSLFGGGPYSLHTPGADYFLATLIVGGLVFLAVSGRVSVLRWAPLVMLGEISYPLYLVHQRIGVVVLRAAPDLGVPSHWQTALALLITVGLAVLIHRLIEVPGRRLIRGTFSRPPLPVSAAPAVP
jgi:peptidoglycan/LPS O-acetylase OafA/YrhL